jgi:hypothetical protein
MIRISDSLTESRLDDELVLLDEKSGKYFGLNSVGSRMFTLLKEIGDEGLVLTALIEEYNAPKERIKADLAAFIAKLSENGFIEKNTP